MSFDLLSKKFEMKRIDFKELPSELTATVENYAVRDDKRGKEALFLTVYIKDKDVQMEWKYGKMFVGILIDALRKFAFKNFEEIKGKTFLWERKEFITNLGVSQRYFPKEIDSGINSEND